MSRRSLVIAHHQCPCADCTTPIESGQVITDTVDGWAHHECPKAPAPVQGSLLCVECFTYRALNGACCCDPREAP